MEKIQSVCVFCGSKMGAKPTYAKEAYALGSELAAQGLRLVYGAGDMGLMGMVAKGSYKNGGKITGIIPQFLMSKEQVRMTADNLDEVLITENMHERKMQMFEKADAFVALPGGIGTLEELVEQMTWSQLGQHEKPILIANFESFWDPFLTLIDHMRSEGFLGGTYDVDYLVAEKANEIIPLLQSATSRWKKAVPVADDITSQM